MNAKLANRIYDTPTSPQFHAILAAILGREPKTTARYIGFASVTSDGFCMCSFIDPNGCSHHGAFVGSMADIERNIEGLKAHLKLSKADRAALDSALRAWICVDYRRAA